MRSAVAAAHGVAVHDLVLLSPGEVPRTSSGKISRAACRTRYLAGEDERRGQDQAGWQDWLLTRLTALLGRPVTERDVDRPLADCGLSSRDAVTLVAEIAAQSGKEVPTRSCGRRRRSPR